MGSRGDSQNDPLFPTHVADWQSGEEVDGNDAVYREGKWWWKANWQNRRKYFYKDRERIRKNKSLRAFLNSQSTSTGL